MKTYCCILLHLIVLFSLIGCKESTDTPPFVFGCNIKLINDNGSSPFQNNKDKIKLISVKLQEPLEAKVINVDYLEYSDELYIQLSEWNVANRNKGNLDREYIAEIQYPEGIRKEIDILRGKFLFKDYRPSIVGAFYNDEKPHNMNVGSIFFEIEN